MPFTDWVAGFPLRLYDIPQKKFGEKKSRTSVLTPHKRPYRRNQIDYLRLHARRILRPTKARLYAVSPSNCQSFV